MNLSFRNDLFPIVVGLKENLKVAGQPSGFMDKKSEKKKKIGSLQILCSVQYHHRTAPGLLVPCMVPLEPSLNWIPLSKSLPLFAGNSEEQVKTVNFVSLIPLTLLFHYNRIFLPRYHYLLFL